MSELVFVKLGGSVITNKTQPETARPERIARLAGEVASARAARPGLRLVVGHGSGSFGHVVAQRTGTHGGVYSSADWRGFVEVAAVAARLNRVVTDAFLAAGVPVWSLPPSASALCRRGELVSLALTPVERALAGGVVPLVYGDVALDELQGGTIVSTEQVLAYLARRLRPARFVLVGEVDGVFEADPLRKPSARPIAEITAANWPAVRARLGGSHGTDVTGGMLSKAEEMVRLARELPGLDIQMLSGERSDVLKMALLDPAGVVGGTRIRW